MIIAFVKHYLTEGGVKFFEEVWFSTVKAAISQQEGFLFIDAERDGSNQHCMNICLKFADWGSVKHWAQTPLHDQLVDQLDPYRISDWEVAKLERENDEDILPSELHWEKVKPSHPVY